MINMSQTSKTCMRQKNWLILLAVKRPGLDPAPLFLTAVWF